jgi:hypothetical protein
MQSCTTRAKGRTKDDCYSARTATCMYGRKLRHPCGRRSSNFVRVPLEIFFTTSHDEHRNAFARRGGGVARDPCAFGAVTEMIVWVSRATPP